MKQVKGFLAEHGEKVGLGGILLLFLIGLGTVAVPPEGMGEAIGDIDRIKTEIETTMAQTQPRPQDVGRDIRTRIRSDFESVLRPSLWELARYETIADDAGRVVREEEVVFPEMMDAYFYVRPIIQGETVPPLRLTIGGEPGRYLFEGVHDARLVDWPAVPTGVRVFLDAELVREEGGDGWVLRVTPRRETPGTEPVELVVEVSTALQTKRFVVRVTIEEPPPIPRFYPPVNPRVQTWRMFPGRARITWEHHGANTVPVGDLGYLVERSEDGGTTWTPLTVDGAGRATPIRGTVFDDVPLEQGKSYRWRVRTVGPPGAEPGE